MTYINNIAHIHNDIIRLGKQRKTEADAVEAKTAQPAPETPKAPEAKPVSEVTATVEPPLPTAKIDNTSSSAPGPIPTSVSPNADNEANGGGKAKPPASTKPTAPPKDYKAELKSFTEDPNNQPTGLAKAYSVFSKMKGTFGDVMNKYAENRLQSFLGGQDKKFRPSMRTRHPNPTEQYAQQYKELSGKPIFNRSQLNKDMKVLNSMRGEAGEHIKAWYKLQHLKTGRVPKLDQEMINQITLQLKEQNKAKRKTKPKKEEV